MSTVHISVRIPETDLEQIDRHAKARGITRTALLIDGALERLPEQQEALETRVKTLERTVERLEDFAFGGH